MSWEAPLLPLQLHRGRCLQSWGFKSGPSQVQDRLKALKVIFYAGWAFGDHHACQPCTSYPVWRTMQHGGTGMAASLSWLLAHTHQQVGCRGERRRGGKFYCISYSVMAMSDRTWLGACALSAEQWNRQRYQCSWFSQSQVTYAWPVPAMHCALESVQGGVAAGDSPAWSSGCFAFLCGMPMGPGPSNSSPVQSSAARDPAWEIFPGILYGNQHHCLVHGKKKTWWSTMSILAPFQCALRF